MQEIMVPCKKCGNKAPASSMKLDLDEKMMICPDCVKNKRIHKEIKEEVFDKKKPQATVQAEEKAESSLKVQKKCTSCGYKFTFNTDTGKPKNCPYCNARMYGI